MQLGAYRIKLVADAKQAWRWSSIRLLALAGVLQTVLIAFPEKAAQYVPEWLMSALATTSLLIMVLAGVARITQVEKTDGSQPFLPASDDHGHGE